MIRRSLGIGAFVILTACSGAEKDPNLLNIVQPASEGPDEFAILPAKPLEVPEGLTAQPLPLPTPGAANRADLTPDTDAMIALGGNPNALTRDASGDTALLRYTDRYGRDANIRPRLAAADLEFRRNNDGLVLERLFSVNVYFRAYEDFELDQYAELERLRRAGIRTSSVPPNPSPETP